MKPDTVLDQQFRGTEPFFDVEVVRNDRFAGMKRIAGRGRCVGADGRDANHI